MDPERSKTSRDKLKAWLDYYRDLNLGEFYKDRASVRVAVSAEQPHTPRRHARASLQSVSTASLPPTPTSAAARSALPVLDAPSLFDAADRVEDDTLERIREDLGDCTRCRLYKQRNNIVFGVGNAAAELVFVGEGPGHDEDVQGLPFVGRAGKLLTQMIEAMGLARGDVYICNVVKCRPPENRTPAEDEIATCSLYLYRQLEVIRPKAIVCLGGVAAQTLLKTKDPISRYRGVWLDFRGTKLLATYHPAYLLRNPNAKGEVWKDLQKVMSFLGLKPKKPLR